jgi:hypothetical protein
MVRKLYIHLERRGKLSSLTLTIKYKGSKDYNGNLFIAESKYNDEITHIDKLDNRGYIVDIGGEEELKV